MISTLSETVGSAGCSMISVMAQLLARSSPTGRKTVFTDFGIARAGFRDLESRFLDVVVQGEFVGMGTQPQRLDLVSTLVLDPALDGVLTEDISRQQEFVILLESIESSTFSPSR